MEEINEKYGKYILLSRDNTDSPVKNLMEHTFVCMVIIGILYWVGGHDSLMFHSVIELFSVAVSWALFILIWNTRNHIVNNGLVFLGISYFFVGLLHLVHMFGSGNMGDISGDNSASQIWLASRLLESLSLLSFPWLFSKRMRHGIVFLGLMACTFILLLSVFSWNLFPECLAQDGGLTFFAKAGEYSVIIILFFSLLSLFRHRNLFEQESYNLLFASIALGFLSAVSSVFFFDVSGLYNQMSQFLQLGSLFLVYLALIRKGIKKPFAVLFREIAKAAQEIRTSRKHCRTILDNQPDQIMLHDLNNKIIWANKAACEYAGLPRESICGRSCFEIWGQNNEICAACSVNDAIKTGRTGNTIIRTPDGESWQIRSCPIHDESGTVTQILELRENMTERLKAEEKLRLSENNFQKAFDNSSSILMSITDIETGVFHEVNKAFLRATGYDEEELIGRSSLDIDLIDRDVRKKMVAHLFDHGKYDSIRISFKKKNKEILDTLFSGEVVMIDGQKKMLTIAQDMTDFFRTKAELEKEKALLQAVFESTHDFFILKDRDSVYQKANPSFCKFMGVEDNQVIGKTDYSFHPDLLAEQYILEDRKVIETGLSSCLDRQFSGEHETRWVQVVKTPVVDASGETTGILCSVRDVTERRQMEDLLKVRLRISEFSISNSLTDILKKTLEEAERLTESSISFLHSIEHDHDSVSFESWCLNSENNLVCPDQNNPKKVFVKKAELMECVRRRMPVIHNDYILHTGCAGLLPDHEAITRDLVVPVFEGERVTAILGVGNKKSDYSQSDMDTVMELANMVWDIISRKRSQMELNESQRKHKTLLDNLPGMAFRCKYDFGWTIEYASDGCFQITGYRSEELINSSRLSFNNIIYPDDRKRLRSEIRAAVKHHKPYEIEYRIVHKDSSLRWVWERGTGVWDESGRIVSLEGFVNDMTEKITAKDMLKQQTHMLQTILDGTPDILILMKPDHTIISGNKAAYEQLGKKSGEIEGRKCFEMFGRDRRCDKCATSIALQSKRNATLDRYEPVLNRWFQINTIPIFGEDGKVSMIVEQLQDITERRDNEAELRRLASAIHHVAETIVITDNNGNIKYANPSFEQTTGFSCREVLGKNPNILKSGVQEDSFYKELWQTITSGETWYGRMVNRKKDGSLFTEDVSISPVGDDNGRIIEFVAVKRDITNELNLEAQLFQAQKMEAIGSLAGGIAHDFNNILFPMMGYGEMLQMDLPEDSFLQDYVLEILRASKRAKALVQQILAFSRQSDHEKAAVRIQSILNEVIRFSRASLPSTITVKTSLDKKCRPVLADPNQIHQVAMNLITNALHAMEEKGGDLCVSLREVFIEEDMMPVSPLPRGFYAHLAISDTGCGIDPSIQDKIFNPYFTTKEKGKGTGIGLAVVHGIVKSHGGSIELKSEPHKGTTFDIFLPCIKEDGGEIHRDTIIPASGGDERILVVDDEEPIARMLRQILERLGHSVTVRTSSIEAFQLFKDNPERFDLIITDMTMPGMTGDRLSMEIKKIRPNMPIIICTGFSEKINEEIARSMGIDGYVFKPVLQNELTAMIRSVLSSRE